MSASICAPCFRALRHQARRELRQTPKLSLRSLSAARPFATTSRLSSNPPPPPSEPNDEAIKSFASSMRNQAALSQTTEPYVAYGSTEDLFRACALHAAYTIPSLEADPPSPAPKNAAEEDVGTPTVANSFWYRSKEQGGLALECTFNTWAQITFLYMYTLTTRLRSFPPEHAQTWHQNLIDHFFYAAEDRMATWHGMSARGTRNKYLKDLWQQWRGVSFSYDEGLIRGDAVLAGAVWRNVFKGDVEADLQDVAMVTAFLRSQVQLMAETKVQDLAAGTVNFEEPQALDRTALEAGSKLMGTEI